MKIKKILFLSMFLIIALLFIPNIVNAETNLDGGAFIELKNIKLGGKGQEFTYAVGGEHFTTPLIKITWYESSNGNDYTLMDKDSTFDYNIYYKALLDTSYDYLNNNHMEENWELGGLSIHIIDDSGEEIDSKSGFRGNDKLEYVFKPFWKYSVHLDLENMEYYGLEEIVEGEDFVGQLVPKKNYRLPTTEEARDYGMIRISTNGNTTSNYYNSHNGMIEIPSQDIKGYIEILARAVEKEKIEFNNDREYIYVKDNNTLDFAVSFEQTIDTLYINEKIVSEDDYSFDRENGILTLNEGLLNKLEVGTYVLRIENNNRYAETNFSVQEIKIVETYKITFDANGGEFAENDKFVVEDIINFNYANFNRPTREGYGFVGFFTEKTGGKSFEEIMSSEEGIKSDITFYAHWEENTIEDEGSSIPAISEGGEQEDNNNADDTNQGNANIGTDNTNTDDTNQENTNIGTDNNTEAVNNPQTSDNIMLYVLILPISIWGIIITTKIKKNK